MRCHCAKQPLVYPTRQISTFSRHARNRTQIVKEKRRLFEEWEKSSVEECPVWNSSPRAAPGARFQSNVLTTRLRIGILIGNIESKLVKTKSVGRRPTRNQVTVARPYLAVTSFGWVVRCDLMVKWLYKNSYIYIPLDSGLLSIFDILIFIPKPWHVI